MTRALIDAGPLIALIDPRDPAHRRCVDSLDPLVLPLVTTWPAFTEAMYFLHRSGGWPHQRQLWGFVADETLEIYASTATEEARMQQLMEQYVDTPMDLADASLVATAESLGISHVFTLDSDFRVYRTATGSAFDLIPE